MKFIKFLLLLIITIALIYVLANPLKIKDKSIPPLGYFLDPFNGFLKNAEKEALPFDKELQLSGLSAPVTIIYDSNYVPHVFANNNEDLFYSQGYIMAQNRLWQMEFQVMAAAGRLSEIIGENKNIQHFDRLQRRKGMVFGAKKSLDLMSKDPELLKYLEAYKNGVNTYIASLSYESLPFEYKLLNYYPEKWDLLKTSLILEYMIDNLTGFDEDLENTNALKLLGKDTFNLLFPERVPGLDPTVPTDQPWSFEHVEIPEGDENYPDITNFKVVKKSDPDNGSNNWAIAPEKSATGNAILASDPHLGLNLPSLWMMLHLNSPDYNVYGFTFPGALGVTIGFNDSISWAFTNAPRDTRDWYAIKFKNANKNEYWYDSTYRPTKNIIEEIKIKGKESLFDTVTYTHHGPVVYDHKFTGSGTDLALRWGGHEGSMVQKSILLLNQANNYEDYNVALHYWDQPPQNAVFASVKGNIAMTIAGDFPLKWTGQGKFIMDGSNPVHDWQESIPKEHNAMHLNPERGFVSSANQHSVDEDYPYWFYSSTNEYYRNRRINRKLSQMDSITVKQVMELQNDSYTLKAEEILPLLLDSIKGEQLNPSEKEILDSLTAWDYYYKPFSSTPIYFEAWWREFYNTLWDEFDRKEILVKPDAYVTIYLLKEGLINEYINIKSTKTHESLSELITQTFKKSIEKIKDWEQSNGKDLNWGNYKNTSIIHLARIPALSRKNIAVSGHADAINSTKGNHGPSFRMVVEMTSPPTAWGIYPGGQSGNPGSRAYDNFMEEWRDGDYRKLSFPSSVDEAKKSSEKIQILNPEQK